MQELLRKKERGDIGRNLNTSGVDRDLYEFYLMSLSGEIYKKKLCQRYTKTCICDVVIKVLNKSYSANTQTNLKITIKYKTVHNFSSLLLKPRRFVYKTLKVCL